jgi:hypothetical protein
MKSRYEDFLERKRQEFGPAFDTSELNTSFIYAYNSDTRVTVYIDGRKLTGYVGITTGWKPCFLLMRAGARSSSVLLVKGYTHEPL